MSCNDVAPAHCCRERVALGKMRAMRVFISYRRDDSMVTAALLYRELTSRPEFADAFMDIRNIGYGDNFVASIDKALGDAEVVVVVIGPRWTEMLQARLRGDDWVRHEVATALRLRDGAPPDRAPLRVLPVLIGGAKAPVEDALPADLAPLARVGMQTFDERALKASINTLLEALQSEDFEARSRRLEEEHRKLEEERRRPGRTGRRNRPKRRRPATPSATNADDRILQGQDFPRSEAGLRGSPAGGSCLPPTDRSVCVAAT